MKKLTNVINNINQHEYFYVVQNLNDFNRIIGQITISPNTKSMIINSPAKKALATIKSSSNHFEQISEFDIAGIMDKDMMKIYNYNKNAEVAYILQVETNDDANPEIIHLIY